MNAEDAFNASHRNRMFQNSPMFVQFRNEWFKEWDTRKRELSTPGWRALDLAMPLVQFLSHVVMAAVLGAGFITIIFMLWVSPDDLQKIAASLANGTAAPKAIFANIGRLWFTFTVVTFGLLAFSNADVFNPFGGELPSDKRVRNDMRDWAKDWWIRAAGARPFLNADEILKHD